MLRARRLQLSRPLTQTELAALTGLSTGQIRRLESGTQLPRILEAVLRVAAALRVPVESVISATRGKEIEAEIEERRKSLRGVPTELSCRAP